MAPQWFSQFPDPCVKGGTVTITVGAGAPFPFHCTLSWSNPPGGGTSWICEDVNHRVHTIPVPSTATGGTVVETANKSLSLALNIL